MLNRQLLLWLLLTLLISTSKSNFYDGDPFYLSPDIDSTPWSFADLNITIFIVGRSGSGVSSTIKELIGPNSECQLPDGSETVKKFMEYTLKIPSPLAEHPDYNIKLVDVPGLVDGRTLEMDAQILASMKSYTNKNGFPDYYLALSRFDEIRFAGEHSLFVKFLRRIELFQKTLLGTASGSNTVFVLTELMSVGRSTQSKPQSKINIFKGIIKEYTSFVPPITIIVGENFGQNYGLKIEDDYYKLPNNQHYPKNIWESLFNITSASPDDPAGLARQQILTAVMNNRETINVRCEARLIPTDWRDYADDAQDYLYFLEQNNMTAEENEVNSKIQHEFNKLSPQLKEELSIQKLGLQLRLQEMNITKENDLPKTAYQRAELFHYNRLSLSSGASAILSTEAFAMRIPEYNKPLTVGCGYDLIGDELIPQSPFRMDVLRPSEVGYQLPVFLNCRHLFQPDIKYYKSYSQSISDYTEERLKYLDFDSKENVSDYKFFFKLKEGFNLKPEGSNDIETLSAVQEIRTVKCSLHKEYLHLPLNEEILAAVNSLTEFDRSKRDSVNEWKNFFNVFGSHIVTESYGGGVIRGRLVGSNRRDILESEIESDLNSIVKFTNFLDLPKKQPPSYIIDGGIPNAQLYHPYDVSNDERKLLLNKWRDSLRSDFVMLNYELGLEPISTFIKVIDQEKGEFVEKAIELLLRGQLKYRRGVNPRRVTTRRPSETSQAGVTEQDPGAESISFSTGRPKANIPEVPWWKKPFLSLF